MGHLYKLNLRQIEKSLLEVQRNFDNINARLDVCRDPMHNIIIANMLSGYHYINSMLDNNIKLFSKNGIHHVLELNYIVLCGTDIAVRNEYIKHVSATDKRFYEQEDFNIGHLSDWYGEKKKKSVWKRAAGVYILMVSQPQLFYEGNHRTGALVMSYILAREKTPPFVLTVDNAEAYFNPSTLVKSTRKNLINTFWKLSKIQKYFAKFLQKQADKRYLVKN